jgi:prolyl 4-hydroxylase
MYSYIFGFIAIFIVFSNPIGQLLWPGEHDGGASSKLRRTERPRLNESLLAIEDEFDSALACPADQYRTHILSREPLVIYIENFISTEEIASLLDLRWVVWPSQNASSVSWPSV